MARRTKQWMLAGLIVGALLASKGKKPDENPEIAKMRKEREEREAKQQAEAAEASVAPDVTISAVDLSKEYAADHGATDKKICGQDAAHP